MGRLAAHHDRRHSGKPRSVILGYSEDGPNHVSMAMNGWRAAEPAWWLNLQDGYAARRPRETAVVVLEPRWIGSVHAET